jgi:ABC-2 type transport system ATP-binding protein
VAALRGALQRAGAEVAEEPDGALAVRRLPVERVGEIAAAQGIVLHELRRQASTLEEAFFALTADPGGPPARPDVEGSA